MILRRDHGWWCTSARTGRCVRQSFNRAFNYSQTCLGLMLSCFHVQSLGGSNHKSSSQTSAQLMLKIHCFFPKHKLLADLTKTEAAVPSNLKNLFSVIQNKIFRQTLLNGWILFTLQSCVGFDLLLHFGKFVNIALGFTAKGNPGSDFQGGSGFTSGVHTSLNKTGYPQKLTGLDPKGTLWN